MTTIEWTDETWNPVTGCTKVSQGCKNCYAEKVFPRAYSKDQWPKGDGTFRRRLFTDVECHENRLMAPLSWRKPRRIFVNSMSDLFHEDVPDEFIDQVFAVMALAPQHTFQVLTKRPERMRTYMVSCYERVREQQFARGIGIVNVTNDIGQDGHWPPRNVWLGVSVEDQVTAKKRIWPLLQTPAARRFVSYEPGLGPVDLDELEALHANWRGRTIGRYLDWVIVGGESGPGARPFDVKWAWTIIEQCNRSQTPVFVKQLGAKPFLSADSWAQSDLGINLRDRKGADISEWPQLFRVREFPCA